LTWAKITDNFGDDPVLLGLARGVRLLHVEAIVWCCKHETDGRIPRHVLGRITDEPEPYDAADHLVAAGLWRATTDGYEITGFLIDQRSAGEVEVSRANSRARQERHRRHQNRDHSLCDPRYCHASNGASNAVTNGVSNGSPTRPDPTRPELKRGTVGEGGTADRAGARPPAPHPSQKPRSFTVTDKGWSA
jgi:hypothetical protein